MKRWFGALGVVVLIALVAWMLRTPETATKPAEAAPGSSATTPASPPPPGSTVKSTSSTPQKTSRARKINKEEHAALRRKIAERLDAGGKEPAKAQAAAGQPDAESTPSAGGLRDRTGGTLTKFMGTLNDDFMPLADECFEQAREADPQLQGLLDLEFSLIADEELGGLVDTIELGGENEIDAPQLTECIRETMLSTMFPSPEGSGQAKVRLTIPVEPEAQ